MTTTAPVPLSAPAARPFPYLGLGMLAVAIFLNVTIEMIPTGLLPEMSADLGVSEALVGLLVTVFAFTVVLTSTTLVALTRRLPRHALVVGVLAVFALSCLSTALAPTYPLVVASRVFGGLAHGVFWAVVGAYSSYLVPREQLGRAVAITLGGGSLAFVLGVPLGTALGQWLGWRAAFGGLAALVAVGALLIWRFLPRVDHLAAADAPETSAAGGGRGRSVGGVVLLCTITGVIMIGQYTFYTYVAPYFSREAGLGDAAISPLLFAYGVAGAVGLAIVGAYLGSRPRIGLVVSLAATIVAIGLLTAFPHVPVVSVSAFALWGLALGGLPALLQTRLLQVAPVRMRDTASAFFTTAFNVGIGGGALVGAIVLETLGLRAIPAVYLGILVLALAVVLVSDALSARRRA